MKKLLTLATVVLTSTLIAPAFAADTMNNNTNSTNNSAATVKGSTNYNQADQDKWWHDRDVNNDGKISKKEYIDNETRDGKTTAAKAAADFAKKDKDGDGYISASEFKAWFEKVGDKVQNSTSNMNKGS